MNQLIRIMLGNGVSLYFRWPYQAKVMKTFEMVNKKMVFIVMF